MAKKLPYCICLYTVLSALSACDGMATLFHGPKPEEKAPMFTVTFDANGATGTVPGAQTVNSGTVITMPGGGLLSKDGYVFTGWNVSGGGIPYPPESSYTVTADQTFYAQWTDPSQAYTVTYDANGASGTPPSPQKAVHNGNIIVAGKGNLANANKTFAGWNTAADGLGANYNAGDALAVTADMTLYARWGENVPADLLISEALTWISGNAVDGGEYIITVVQDETCNSQTLFYGGKNVRITLKGDSVERKISSYSITIGNLVTLTLDGNITLQGRTGNTLALVVVSGGGKLVMNTGSKISGNTSSSSSSFPGGGVHISSGGTFTMNGGTISGNTSSSYGGGGVYVLNSTFTMNGGTISGNTSSSYGGGVYVSNSTFTMRDGIISGNTSSYGGGVYVLNSTFTMRSGIISGNTSRSGGGVYVGNNGTFTKQSGGTIYGSEDILKNTATQGDSYGHAVYAYTGSKKRNTTADVGVTMDSSKSGSAGGWQ